MSLKNTFNYNQYNIKQIPLLPLVIPLVIYVFSIYFLYLLPFTYTVDTDLIMLSVVDYLLSITTVYIFFMVNKYRIFDIDQCLKVRYLNFIKNNFLFFLILVLYSLYATYKNLMLVVLSGYNREGLLNEVSAGYLDMLLPNLFSCMFVVSVIYKYPFRIKLLFLTGVISVMLFYLSRSNLLFLIFFPIVFLFVFQYKLNYKKIMKFLLIGFSIVIFASYITILQGRAENIQEVIFKIAETMFRYKAYSFYLAEYAIEVSSGIEKSLFPFLGWFSEKLIALGWKVDNPISIYGSNFVFKFHFLGNGYRANVLYPWWSWFYGYYGVLGLLLKAVYTYAILYVTLRFKLSLTFLFFLYTVLFNIVVKHPFINAAAFYAFAVLIILDILTKVKFGNYFNGKNSIN